MAGRLHLQNQSEKTLQLSLLLPQLLPHLLPNQAAAPKPLKGLQPELILRKQHHCHLPPATLCRSSPLIRRLLVWHQRLLSVQRPQPLPHQRTPRWVPAVAELGRSAVKQILLQQVLLCLWKPAAAVAVCACTQQLLPLLLQYSPPLEIPCSTLSKGCGSLGCHRSRSCLHTEGAPEGAHSRVAPNSFLQRR